MIRHRKIRSKLAVAAFVAALAVPVGAAAPAVAAPSAPTTFNDNACIIQVGINYIRIINGVKWAWVGYKSHPKQTCPSGIWVRL